MFLSQSNMSNLDVDPEKIKLARCQTKCIPDEYAEADLNKGETVCIDRCVAKFMKASRIVGGYAQSIRLDTNNLVVYEDIKRNYCSSPDPDSKY
ncbi:hypothetical protein B5S33_g2580 [[Candida] boidinii]|nr:hypothetical protein B5S27_g4660 [[Candida] boidinii]OWB83944.1 hypothetical protein B5S33_g2580 [[Candida] boidinii]